MLPLRSWMKSIRVWTRSSKDKCIMPWWKRFVPRILDSEFLVNGSREEKLISDSRAIVALCRYFLITPK